MSNGTGVLAASQFTGSYAPRAGNAVQGGQATYAGSIAVTLFDRSVVSQVLPPGFALATRTDAKTTHPVVHLIGNPRHPMVLLEGEAYPALDNGYQEMILLVPFVVRPPGTSWHSFVVRMYLNDIGAIEIGNTVYAYNKEFAHLPQNHAAGSLVTKVQPLLSADVFMSTVTRQSGPWSSAASAAAQIPGWADFQALFAMPLVGVDTDPSNTTVTRVVCSYWEWDYAHSSVSMAASNHEFLQQFRAGMGNWVAQPLSSAPNGAIMIRDVRWRLAIPPPGCQF